MSKRSYQSVEDILATIEHCPKCQRARTLGLGQTCAVHLEMLDKLGRLR